MDFESHVIAGFKNKFIGDDGAVLGQWVASKDLFCENTHFKRGWLSPKAIAYKSMIVNISDAIAMNARPKYVLLGLGLDRADVELVDGLRAGFKQACDEFGCEIVGGDTIKSSELNISISVLSRLENGAKALRRTGLKAGDLIAHTGELGSSLAGLKALLNGGKARSKSRFVRPVLRGDFIYKAARFLRCGMDISDGLSRDLGRLCAINRLGFKFKKAKSKQELSSGEEYEMLVAFSPRHLHKIARLAQKSRTKLSVFGIAKRGKYRHWGKGEHF
ncbi:thiamine-phosphate kinase [Campylobacter sp. 19-13652]|uniref:thiamine-phosphate kinase n=1 Tax=Campylobacter sp. 19-13652 TaxID=2840180 RepID=UPI001C772280|nr:thiamine-phosphate kinase [Campylobacter sp. 19-13652]BCX78792.1 thiamine-monophosphate kinase [Campylobacter sp. 19-13652]